MKAPAYAKDGANSIHLGTKRNALVWLASDCFYSIVITTIHGNDTVVTIAWVSGLKEHMSFYVISKLLT